MLNHLSNIFNICKKKEHTNIFITFPLDYSNNNFEYIDTCKECIYPIYDNVNNVYILVYIQYINIIYIVINVKYILIMIIIIVVNVKFGIKHMKHIVVNVKKYIEIILICIIVVNMVRH
jgi:hypothetical protein